MSKLFTIGPVEMYPETMKIGAMQVPYFRTPEFSEIVLDSATKLQHLLGCDEAYRTVLLTASGTGAMEATIMNCFTEEDRLLVIQGGGFGKRFVELCEIHKIPNTPVIVPEGTVLTKEMIDNAAACGEYTGLLVNIHESSTGQLYDIKMLSNYCKEHGLIFVVDAISSFLADQISCAELGIDAIILSSQKALSLAPGLSFVVISERMLNDRVNRINSGIMYLDFKDHLKNMERGQTPFTPAVRLVYELNDMLTRLEIKGIEAISNEIRMITEDFRRKIRQIGLSYPEYPLSNAATPVIFSGGNAKIVYERLRSEYGLVVNPSGGEQGNYQFRVGHIGFHTKEDNDVLVSAIAKILEDEVSQ